MEILPHDEVISRLKKNLERREEKLAKKATRWNLIQRNNIRSLLKQWEADREEEAPNTKEIPSDGLNDITQ